LFYLDLRFCKDQISELEKASLANLQIKKITTGGLMEGLMTQEKVRESVIAGSWYPGHPETLKKHIEKYLDEAQPAPLGGALIGLIVPHAGYVYSGGVAAHAYKTLRRHPFDRVLILAPSHRARFQGASVYRLGGYRTPLGTVPLDYDMVDSLSRQSSLFHFVPQAESQEHSLEIQLPFLQVVLSEFHLTPVLMGDQSFETCQELADAIVHGCAGKEVLLIASSDLSHYHPYQEAKRLDQVVLDRVSAFDPAGLAADLDEGICEACGSGPMMTLMLAAQRLGANKAKTLHYANSGDVTGDTQGVVGYLAAAFYNNPGKSEEMTSSHRHKASIDLGLSLEEKQILRDIALQAIRSKCLRQPAPTAPLPTPKLKEWRGAFVCLHKGKDLRGCIGMIEGHGPLHRTVKEMALQAAFSDPRFCPLAPEELEHLDLEISVLTPLERIQDPGQVEIGKHGLLIRKEFSSGLLLPQVATEQGWDRCQFLEATCRKASLPPTAWREKDTEIYVFSADIF
jgi:MEMO1 family protein